MWNADHQVKQCGLGASDSSIPNQVQKNWTGCLLVFEDLKLGRTNGRQEQAHWTELARCKMKFIVDLREIQSLDQERLALLLRFRTFVRASGGEVSLASLSCKVRLQAQRMHLHRLFEIFNTPAEAQRCCPA